jgi:hypothetical protein
MSRSSRSAQTSPTGSRRSSPGLTTESPYILDARKSVTVVESSLDPVAQAAVIVTDPADPRIFAHANVSVLSPSPQRKIASLLSKPEDEWLKGASDARNNKATNLSMPQASRVGSPQKHSRSSATTTGLSLSGSSSKHVPQKDPEHPGAGNGRNPTEPENGPRVTTAVHPPGTGQQKQERGAAVTASTLQRSNAQARRNKKS